MARALLAVPAKASAKAYGVPRVWPGPPQPLPQQEEKGPCAQWIKQVVHSGKLYFLHSSRNVKPLTHPRHLPTGCLYRRSLHEKTRTRQIPSARTTSLSLSPCHARSLSPSSPRPRRRAPCPASRTRTTGHRAPPSAAHAEQQHTRPGAPVSDFSFSFHSPNQNSTRRAKTESGQSEKFGECRWTSRPSFGSPSP